MKKHEMHHHKMREMHKKAHHAKKEMAHEREHEMHKIMMDNRKVKEDHQEGIHRVLQRHGDMEVGQHGKMGMSHTHGDTFKRTGNCLTPAKG